MHDVLRWMAWVMRGSLKAVGFCVGMGLLLFLFIYVSFFSFFGLVSLVIDFHALLFIWLILGFGLVWSLGVVLFCFRRANLLIFIFGAVVWHAALLLPSPIYMYVIEADRCMDFGSAWDFERNACVGAFRD